jgi:lysosomal acid lipase/cholesteryl ester hydrolase
MRNATFQMYDDSLSMASISPIRTSSYNSLHHPARFPTRNIVTPIVLLWGDHDSLVDISVLLNALPDHTVAKRLHNYEHVDILWGKDVHKDVIPEVRAALTRHCRNPDMIAWHQINGNADTDGTVTESVTDAAGGSISA